MKKLSLFEKFLFLINSLTAFIFLISLVIPYLKPSIFSEFSILSLFSPLIIIINILFMFLWIVKLKKHFLLSLIVLIIGIDSLRSFVNFSNDSKFLEGNEISIISYNVRLFNIYNWIDDDNVNSKIRDFLNQQNPDIICLQEYQNSEFKLDNYPHLYEKLRGENLRYGQAIFSKYPIVNKGSLNFKNSSNNAIFSDIKIMNDTIRVYNIHLQSFSFDNGNPLIEINNKNNKLVENISNTFLRQEQQVRELKNSIENSPYKVIISGDLNNTAFSYVYKELSKDFIDTFKEKGNGLGITFNYNFIPLRIDFIFTQRLFKVNSFKTFKLNLSDHEPIYTELKF